MQGRRRRRADERSDDVMKRIVCLVAMGLGLLVSPPAASAAVAVRSAGVARTGYAHASVSRTTVVRGGGGCCYGGYSPVGTAVGVAAGVAVGTAIGNSIAPPVHSTTVVAAPAATTTATVGTIVPALPGGCSTAQ